ncbi:MAG: cellulose biosynthesis cyclic di-GMP-binding regulatory protein BcsB [Culicoidibacterales bacterium]
MKIFWKYSSLMIFILCLMTLLPLNRVQAQTERGIEKTYNYALAEQTLYSQQPITIPVTIPQRAQINQMSLQLNFQTSPTLLPERAFYTVAINGEPLTSGRLNIGKTTTVKLEIPVAKLKQDNVITISGFLKSTELVCEPTDEINWAVLTSDSALTYKLVMQPEIAQWLQQVTAPSGEVALVVPKEMTAFNYEQLVNITSVIEQRQRKLGQDVDFKIVEAGKAKQSQPVVVIGTLEQIQEQFPTVFANQKDQHQRFAENGGIHYQLIGEQWYLFLSSETPEQLKLLIETLAFSDVTEQIQQSSYHLQPLAPRAMEPMALQGSFADYGYETQKVQGIGEQTLNYYVTSPLRQEVKQAAFTFAVRSSELVSQADSFVEIRVNNRTLRTVYLEPNVDEQLITVELPEDLAAQGQWAIQLRFQLTVASSNCETSPHNQAWAEVSASESTYDLTTQPRTNYFVGIAAGVLQNETGQAAGMIQVEPESVHLEDFVQFVTTLTGAANGVAYLQVETTITEASETGLIIGQPTTAALQTYTQNTFFPLTTDGKIVNQTEFVQVATDLGQIQFVQEQPLVIVSAQTPAEMQNIIQAYRRETLPQQAASLLFENDRVVQQAEADINTAGAEKFEALQWEAILPIILTSLIGIVISGYLIVKRMKQNKGNN